MQNKCPSLFSSWKNVLWLEAGGYRMAGLSARSPVSPKCQVSRGKVKTRSPVMIKAVTRIPCVVSGGNSRHSAVHGRLEAPSEIIPPQNPCGEAGVGASAVAPLENAPQPVP